MVMNYGFQLASVDVCLCLPKSQCYMHINKDGIWHCKINVNSLSTKDCCIGVWVPSVNEWTVQKGQWYAFISFLANTWAILLHFLPVFCCICLSLNQYYSCWFYFTSQLASIESVETERGKPNLHDYWMWQCEKSIIHWLNQYDLQALRNG